MLNFVFYKTPFQSSFTELEAKMLSVNDGPTYLETKWIIDTVTLLKKEKSFLTWAKKFLSLVSALGPKKKQN